MAARMRSSLASQRPVKLVEGRAVDDRGGNLDAGGKGAFRRVDRDVRVREAEPLAGEREPGLVDRLLGAEQQAVPAGPRRRDRQLAQPGALGGQGDQLEDAAGKRGVGLRVKPDREQVLRARDRGGAVPRAVRDAADDAVRPQRRAAVAAQDGRRRDAERGERAARALAPRGELLRRFSVARATRVASSGEQPRAKRPAERLRGRRRLRHDLLDHAWISPPDHHHHTAPPGILGQWGLPESAASVLATPDVEFRRDHRPPQIRPVTAAARRPAGSPARARNGG